MTLTADEAPPRQLMNIATLDAVSSAIAQVSFRRIREKTGN